MIKGMTDEQIIKAWKCCCAPSCNCKECPMQGVYGCYVELKYETFNLINRQKAEIERLRNHIMNTLDNLVRQCVEYEVKTAKSEAIKEFAERLTDIICENVNQSLDNPDGNNYYPIDVYEDIDNLVKEMTEQKG